jgi:predicted kinase
MDKSFVMLVGLPGAGKTTLAIEKYGNDPDTIIVSSDAHLEAIAKERGVSYAQAFSENQGEANAKCIAEAKSAFAAGKRVVWDQNNLSIDDRARKLSLVPADYFKAAFAFELTTEELADRFLGRFRETGKAVKPEVMDELAKSYERPGRFEGFDYTEIITH